MRSPTRARAYPGQHERIIAPDLWEAVQKRLNTNTRERQSPANITGTFILTGKLFDETGDRLSPTSANRNGKRHRYYVSAARLPCARNRRGTHERKAGGRTDGGEDATDLTDTMFMERAASSAELVTLPPTRK